MANHLAWRKEEHKRESQHKREIDGQDERKKFGQGGFSLNLIIGENEPRNRK